MTKPVKKSDEINEGHSGGPDRNTFRIIIITYVYGNTLNYY